MNQHLQKAVSKTLERELANQAGTSMFSRDGRLRHDLEGRVGGSGNIHLGEYLQLGDIPYGADPWGSDHATNLARLSEYIASLPGTMGGIVGGPLSVQDQKILYAVATLYAVGKAQGDDDRFAERSAAYADSYLRSSAASNTAWAKQDVREEVCRLILKHADPREIDGDKRLQVFSDARRYEIVRMSPNTSAGLAALRENCTPDKFYTGFAKDRVNLRTWMLRRGWK